MKKIKIKLMLLLSIGIFICSSCNEHKEKEECCKKELAVNEASINGSATPNLESIYQLEGQWITQNNQSINLIDLKGKIQIVAMVFTNCAYACPKIISDLKLIESKIPINQKDKVNFLLISFDTERDTPERLSEFAKEMSLNENWTLLHGEQELVQEVSILLGVKYEKQSDGSFSHSNIITTLDTNGAIIYQQEGLETSPENTINEINKLINKPSISL